MYEFLAKKLLISLGGQNFLSQSEFEIAQYNLTIILVNIGKLSLVYSIAWWADTFLYTLLTNLSFVVLRKFSGGWHALNSIMCTLSSLIIFVGLPKILLKTHWEIKPTTFYIWWLLLSILVLRYAPADTEANPLVNRSLRRTMKKKAIIIMALVTTLPVFTSCTNQLFCLLGLTIEVITIHPLYYFLLKRSYNNFEKYQTND